MKYFTRMKIEQTLYALLGSKSNTEHKNIFLFSSHYIMQRHFSIESRVPAFEKYPSLVAPSLTYNNGYIRIQIASEIGSVICIVQFCKIVENVKKALLNTTLWEL